MTSRAFRIASSTSSPCVCAVGKAGTTTLNPPSSASGSRITRYESAFTFDAFACAPSIPGASQWVLSGRGPNACGAPQLQCKVAIHAIDAFVIDNDPFAAQHQPQATIAETTALSGDLLEALPYVWIVAATNPVLRN
jgi:hypothetical protein